MLVRPFRYQHDGVGNAKVSCLQPPILEPIRVLMEYRQNGLQIWFSFTCTISLFNHCISIYYEFLNHA